MKASEEEINNIAAELGLRIAESELADYAEQINKQLDGFAVLDISYDDECADALELPIKRRRV